MLLQTLVKAEDDDLIWSSFVLITRYVFPHPKDLKVIKEERNQSFTLVFMFPFIPFKRRSLNYCCFTCVTQCCVQCGCDTYWVLITTRLTAIAKEDLLKRIKWFLLCTFKRDLRWTKALFHWQHCSLISVLAEEECISNNYSTSKQKNRTLKLYAV